KWPGHSTERCRTIIPPWLGLWASARGRLSCWRRVRVLHQLDEERAGLPLPQLREFGVRRGAVLVLEYGDPLHRVVAHCPPGEHPRRRLHLLRAGPRLDRVLRRFRLRRGLPGPRLLDRLLRRLLRVVGLLASLLFVRFGLVVLRAQRATIQGPAGHNAHLVVGGRRGVF